RPERGRQGVNECGRHLVTLAWLSQTVPRRRPYTAPHLRRGEEGAGESGSHDRLPDRGHIHAAPRASPSQSGRTQDRRHVPVAYGEETKRPTPSQLGIAIEIPTQSEVIGEVEVTDGVAFEAEVEDADEVEGAVEVEDAVEVADEDAVEGDVEVA